MQKIDKNAKKIDKKTKDTQKNVKNRQEKLKKYTKNVKKWTKNSQNSTKLANFDIRRFKLWLIFLSTFPKIVYFFSFLAIVLSTFPIV